MNKNLIIYWQGANMDLFSRINLKSIPTLDVTAVGFHLS